MGLGNGGAEHRTPRESGGIGLKFTDSQIHASLSVEKISIII